jgi:hypothetical protein
MSVRLEAVPGINPCAKPNRSQFAPTLGHGVEQDSRAKKKRRPSLTGRPRRSDANLSARKSLEFLLVITLEGAVDLPRLVVLVSGLDFPPARTWSPSTGRPGVTVHFKPLLPLPVSSTKSLQGNSLKLKSALNRGSALTA